MSSNQISSFTKTEALSERRLMDPKLAAEKKKPRCIITGGSGKLGRWVVREMVEHGWEVVNGVYSLRFDVIRSRNVLLVDIIPPAASEAGIDARYIHADLTDYGQVLGLLTDVDSGFRGVDGIIHLAAIPAPGKAVCNVLLNRLIAQTLTLFRPTPTSSTQTSYKPITSSKAAVSSG